MRNWNRRNNIRISRSTKIPVANDLEPGLAKVAPHGSTLPDELVRGSDPRLRGVHYASSPSGLGESDEPTHLRLHTMGSADDHTPYAHIIVVAKSAGQFDTIQAAIDSITDAASDKRYLIWVMPGSYSEQITMKSWVDIRGAGKHCTRLTFTGNNNGTVILADWVQIEDFLIEATETATEWAIVGTNVSNLHIRNVDILAASAAKVSQGIKLTGSTWATCFIEHSVINYRGTTGWGISISGNGQWIDTHLTEVYADAWDATSGGALYLSNVVDIYARECLFRGASGAPIINVLNSTQLRMLGCSVLTTVTGSLPGNANALTIGSGSTVYTAHTYICGQTGAGSWTNCDAMDASYLTLAANTFLKSERVLTPGDSLAVTDDGAGGHYHIDAVQDIRSSAGPTFNHLHLNQGANDDEILSLKSSDVAHGVTSITETDTFGRFSKRDGNTGGLSIAGLGESSVGLVAVGYGGAADTGKSASALAFAMVNGHQTSGAGLANCTPDANVFAVRTYKGDALATILLVDEDGDLHIDGSSSAFDAYDDANLVRAFDRQMSPEGVIHNEFDKYVQYNREHLQSAGLVSFNEDGRHFVNVTQLQRLHNGAIWQLYSKIRRLENALKAAGIAELDPIPA